VVQSSSFAKRGSCNDENCSGRAALGFAAPVFADPIDSSSAPDIPVQHPSANGETLVGPGCDGNAHVLGWLDQNRCRKADVEKIERDDPSARAAFIFSGTVVAGRTWTLNFHDSGTTRSVSYYRADISLKVSYSVTGSGGGSEAIQFPAGFYDQT
jgi:hypothetical protein